MSSPSLLPYILHTPLCNAPVATGGCACAHEYSTKRVEFLVCFGRMFCACAVPTALSTSVPACCGRVQCRPTTPTSVDPEACAAHKLRNVPHLLHLFDGRSKHDAAVRPNIAAKLPGPNGSPQTPSAPDPIRPCPNGTSSDWTPRPGYNPLSLWMWGGAELPGIRSMSAQLSTRALAKLRRVATKIGVISTRLGPPRAKLE